MVSKDEVRHLAWLARMDLTGEELEVYSKQVEQILGYLGTLDEVSHEEVEPLRRSVEHTRFRDDTVVEFKEDVLSVVKNVKERFVKGPKMV